MRKKPTKQPSAPAVTVERVVSGHVRELHDFLKHIMSYSEELSNWPLTQQEQVQFVRTVIYQARKLRQSEGYITAALIIASEDLAMTA